ncbi:TRAF family member-associated NF-kappa-B activator-like [Xenopus laevis]|uniref:TRAF family member-associated NF-kappa-B activator-like n=1 Tax=Xenopus laevis TaxID=8355 RepID=A0A8J0UJE7_XENLA|nr:TRAF family member-associated NF-kappa-B activator-like [Xenopus laevis]
MEDAFLALCEEVRLLQTKCRKQAELLEKLLAVKGISNEMPISKPIQCTDVGNPTCSECPFIRLQEKQDQSVESSDTMEDNNTTSLAEDIRGNPSVLLDFDVKFPPTTENFSFLASEVEKHKLDVGHSSGDKDGSNADLESFIKNYTPQFPNINGGKRTCDTTAGGLHCLIPVGADLSMSNLYDEDLCFLQSKDISLGVCLAPKDQYLFGVKGPVQPCWSPSGLSGECQFGCEMDMNSDVGLSSQICEFCQAIFPAGAATKGEYLRHITGHVE